VTGAGLTVAQAYIGAYEAEKRRRHALDFADLVDAARRLLLDAEGAAWVRYKLDRGVDHVLVDEAQDTAPDAFDFADQTDVALSSQTESDIVQITGITGDVATSISGGGGEYRICADATCSTDPAFISTASTIRNNQYLQLRLTSSGSYNTAVATTMTVGTGGANADNWSVTTLPTWNPRTSSLSVGQRCVVATDPRRCQSGASRHAAPA